MVLQRGWKEEMGPPPGRLPSPWGARVSGFRDSKLRTTQLFGHGEDNPEGSAASPGPHGTVGPASPAQVYPWLAQPCGEEPGRPTVF